MSGRRLQAVSCRHQDMRVNLQEWSLYGSSCVIFGGAACYAWFGYGAEIQCCEIKN